LSQPIMNSDNDKKKERIIIERKSDDFLRDVLDFAKGIVYAEELANVIAPKVAGSDGRAVGAEIRRELVLRDRDVFINKKDYSVRRIYSEKIECKDYKAIDGKLVELTLHSDPNNYHVYVARDGEVLFDEAFEDLMDRSTAIESVVADTDRNGKYVFTLSDFSFKDFFHFQVRPTESMMFDAIFAWFKVFVFV